MSTEKSAWLQSPTGQYLLAQEQAMYDAAVGDLFGFNAIQFGMLEMDLLRNSRIPYTLKADVDQGGVHAESYQLPFQTQSLDLLLMPHVLDFTHFPHHTLREAERALVPEGHLLLTGFNPLSFWGLKRSLLRHESYPWNAHFLPQARVKDWLALLDFEVIASSMGCHVPPARTPSWLHRLQFLNRAGERWWPMMGGIYFIVARKRVAGVRLIRPKLPARGFKPALVTVPTQKQPSGNSNNNEGHK